MLLLLFLLLSVLAFQFLISAKVSTGKSSNDSVVNSVLNTTTDYMQLWGNSRTSGRSCAPACLQVPLISFSFPVPPTGTHSLMVLVTQGCKLEGLL